MGALSAQIGKAFAQLPDSFDLPKIPPRALNLIIHLLASLYHTATATMRLLSLLTGLSALFTTSSAAQLTISIPPSPPSLPNPNTLPPSTHASLLGPQGSIQTARLSRSNTLTFPSIPSGSHLLTLHARDHSFSPARIDVDGESIRASVTFRGNEWGNLGPAMGNSTDGQLMIEMRPTGKKDFYQRREGFNVLSIFRNPMILMAVFSGALVFGMPYLMDNSELRTV